MCRIGYTTAYPPTPLFQLETHERVGEGSKTASYEQNLYYLTSET